MMSMYPTEQTVVIDGEEVSWPGLIDGKFSSGNFSDPEKKPSFIPAESINLILDNLTAIVQAAGLETSNTVPTRVREAIAVLAKKDHAIGAMMMFDANSNPVAYSAGSFVAGLRYKIATIGTTDFTLIGAAQNTIGTIFTATGPGTGTGTAKSEMGISGAWVDNVTMPGWYACVAANAVFGCPDLVNRFMMGKQVEGFGSLAGANSHVIATANLPVHVHDIGHNHAASSVTNTNHTHGISAGQGSHNHSQNAHAHADNGHSHSMPKNLTAAFVNGASRLMLSDGALYESIASNTSYASIAANIASNNANTLPAMSTEASNGENSSVSHSHTIPAFVGNSGNGGFANLAIDHRPANYSVIFIRKCA